MDRYEVERAKKSLQMKHYNEYIDPQEDSPQFNNNSFNYQQLPRNLTQKTNYSQSHKRSTVSSNNKKKESQISRTSKSGMKIQNSRVSNSNRLKNSINSRNSNLQQRNSELARSNASSLKTYKNPKRVSIAFKDEEGNTNVIQKLEPVSVVDQYYYQIVEETYNQLGEKRVSIITKNQDGVVIHRKDFHIENIGEIFVNKTYPVARGTLVVVENEKGEVVDSLTIEAQEGRNITLDSYQERDKFSFGDKRNTLILKEKSKTFFVLQPVFVKGRQIQQIVIEEQTPDNQVYTTIVTKNEYGTILAEDQLQGKPGEKYSTLVDNVETHNQKLSQIKTITEGGEVVAQHEIRVTLDNVLGPEFFDYQSPQTKEKFFQKNSSIARVFSAAPIIARNSFYKQFIEEGVDDSGRRCITVITKNQVGEVVGEQKIQKEIQDEKYSTEVIEEGEKKITLATKTEGGEIVSVQNVRPTIFEVLGEDYDFLDQFEKKSKGRSSFTTSLKKGRSTLKKIQIRPTAFANQYVQQMIEQVLENGRVKKTTLITKNEQGDVIALLSLENDNLADSVLHTEIVPHEKKQSVFLVTKDEQEKIIAKQEISKSQIQKLTKDFLSQIQQKALKKVNSKVGKKSISQQLMRPSVIGGNYYYQLIQEVIDEQGQKDVTLITKDELGTIVGVQNLDEQEMVGDLDTETIKNDQEKRVSIIIKNQKGSIIGNQDIYGSKNTSLASKKTSLMQKGQFKIRHSLRPTIVGGTYYHHIVEEVLNENGKEELKVITTNQEGKEIAVQKAKSTLKTANYKSVIVNDYVDTSGDRKVTLEVRNSKNQTLSQVVLRPTINEVIGEYYFDDIADEEIQKNKLDVVRRGNNTVVVKQLRPTLVGLKKLSFFFIEKVDDQSQVKKLTFVAKDEDNQVVAQEVIDPQFISDYYQAYVDKVITEGQSQTAIVNFKNSKNSVIFQKKFRTVVENYYEEIVNDEIESFYDRNGRQTSSVVTYRKNNSTIKKHSLRPTLLGSQFYQQIVHEVIEQGKIRSATLQTLNENGQVIAQDEIENLEGKNFVTEILQEEIFEDGSREFTVGLKNDQKKTIATQKIRATINEVLGENYFDDEILEEVESKNGQKKRSLLKFKKNNSLYVQPLPNIKEEDNEGHSEEFLEHPQDKQKYFEELLENYQFQNKTQRGSLNPLKPLEVHRNNTFQNQLPSISVNNKKSKHVHFGETPEPQTTRIKSHTPYPTNTSPFEEKKVSFGLTPEPAFTRIKSHTPYPSKVSPMQGDQLYVSEMEEEGHKQSAQTDYQSHEEEFQGKDLEEERLRRIIREIFQEERLKMSQEIISSLEKRNLFSSKGGMSNDLQDEFYSFCREQLPKDQKYKESMLFVNLFYYFLKKKRLIN